MKFSPEHLLQILSVPSPVRRLWVAYSGGLDSTVLLHAMIALRERLPAPLAAVHVNHNLQPGARHWEEHCASQCAALAVPFECFSVAVHTTQGASLEAAARDARYDVFRALLETDDVLLTAQHQDDQLETFLLQALRGAGPHGLAAMPPVARLGKGRLLRPLLGWPRAALEAWARSRQLTWLEDPSNADERFDRNYLRRRIVPLLKARWPAAAQTVTRSARHCGQSAEIADELAALDVASCGLDERVLRVSALRRLDLARRRNALRHWLDWLGYPRPSEKKLEHLLCDVLDAAPDAEPCVTWADVCVRRYRDGLYAGHRLAPPQGGDWHDETFDLGSEWGRLQRVAQEGLGLPEGRIEVRFRTGGESIRPLNRAHHHELRKLFQEAGVLPWCRAAIPLIHIDGVLAAVGDLWINADIAKPRGWHVHWENRPRIQAP